MGHSTLKSEKSDSVSHSFPPFSPQSHGKRPADAGLKASKLQEVPQVTVVPTIIKDYAADED